jgi:hypothetical protein
MRFQIRHLYWILTGPSFAVLCVLPLIFLYVCLFHFPHSTSPFSHYIPLPSPRHPRLPSSLPFLPPHFFLFLPPHISPPLVTGFETLRCLLSGQTLVKMRRHTTHFLFPYHVLTYIYTNKLKRAVDGRKIRRISQRKFPIGGLEIRSSSTVIFKGRFGFTVCLSKAYVKYGVWSQKFIWAPGAQLQVLIVLDPAILPPHSGSYTRALLVSQDRLHLIEKLWPPACLRCLNSYLGGWDCLDLGRLPYREVTKRCRLFVLTNSALVHER